MQKIKVLLVADDLVWRECLSNYIDQKEDMVVVGVAVNNETALKMVQLLDLDVVLMDILLANAKPDDMETTIEIMCMKEMKIIMLTSQAKNEIILQFFAAGAINYITKAHYKEIPNAIRAAHRHESFIHADAAEILRKDYIRLKHDELLRSLSPAERKIYDMIEKGYTQSQVVTQLHKAEQTIKNQINTMLKKLGVRRVKDAIHKFRKSRYQNME